jgi:succinoglycan biosynthesis protein ExoU
MGAVQHPGVVCVIIAAKNARGTIDRAVRSALAETTVGEVVVIDDGSTDDTAAVARAADDGSGRVQVLHMPRNLGPAAARNRAIAASSLPYLAVLDADDYWEPGRIARLLLQMRDQDFVADDLLRVVEGREDEAPSALLGQGVHLPGTLDLHAFALANISKRGRNRQEMGFLKPLMRREFLQRTGLRYDESVRLGEDFILYATALARGARFRLVEPCGYMAVERTGSLSASHGAAELAALLAACQTLAREPGLSVRDRYALAAHRRHVRSKLHFHRVLEVRRSRGMATALSVLAADPAAALYVLSEAFAARLQRFRPAKPEPSPIY